uniref:Glutathione peroxidase n=1 Tax=Mastacembelus armatus TaxID=205130 RepID=A0A3Q3S4W9_9TELE
MSVVWQTGRKVKVLQLSLLCFICLKLWAADCKYAPNVSKKREINYGTIYKYQAKTLNGSHTVNFNDYAGKSVLFINVATY